MFRLQPVVFIIWQRCWGFRRREGGCRRGITCRWDHRWRRRCRWRWSRCRSRRGCRVRRHHGVDIMGLYVSDENTTASFGVQFFNRAHCYHHPIATIPQTAHEVSSHGYRVLEHVRTVLVNKLERSLSRSMCVVKEFMYCREWNQAIDVGLDQNC